MIFILLQAAVHVASAVVSLTSTFGTFIILKLRNWEILKWTNEKRIKSRLHIL